MHYENMKYALPLWTPCLGYYCCEAIQIQYEISIADNYILWRSCDKLLALMNPALEEWRHS